MSVLIKGMEMPTSCEDCSIKSWDCEGYVCPFSGIDTLNIGRQRDCPLVPVQPHGDLIDRSVLYKKTAEWEEQARHLANTAPDARTFDKWATILTERSSFKFDVADAPTIIPAEPPKDEAPAGPYDLLYEEGGPDT